MRLRKCILFQHAPLVTVRPQRHSSYPASCGPGRMFSCVLKPVWIITLPLHPLAKSHHTCSGPERSSDLHIPRCVVERDWFIHTNIRRPFGVHGLVDEPAGIWLPICRSVCFSTSILCGNQATQSFPQCVKYGRGGNNLMYPVLL